MAEKQSMQQRGSRWIRRLPPLAAMALVAGMVAFSIPAGAAVTAVTGSAFGYQLNVSLFGGPVNTRGVGQVTCTSPNTPPGCVAAGQAAASSSPSVALAADASNSPQSGTTTATSGFVGPAQIFSSGQIDASSTATIGATGSVTSTTNIANVGRGGAESFGFGPLDNTTSFPKNPNGLTTSISSTCTTSAAGGVSGSTTVTNGQLELDNGFDPVGDGSYAGAPGAHPPVRTMVPTHPAVNLTYTGHIEVNGSQDFWKYVFNEQIASPDGSLTVYAAHEYLLGPTAIGDLFVGQVVCGLTGTPDPTTTTTTTTAPATTTTTTAPSAGAAITALKGGATGYVGQISLFGGAQPHDGPTPTVTLAADGTNSPQTATAPSGLVRHGPAVFFSSDRLDVSTQGTIGATGSVTSSVNIINVNRSLIQPTVTGSEIVSADTVHSTCTASGSGITGSTTFANAVLQTDNGDTTNGTGGIHPPVNVPVPASPPANGAALTGHIHVNSSQDNFHVVFNEQITNPDGSLTVNAVHEFLDGPTAVGELIIGQSVCGVIPPPSNAIRTTTAGTTTTTSTTVVRQTASVGGGGSGLAATGGAGPMIAWLGAALLAAAEVTRRLAHRSRPPEPR